MTAWIEHGIPWFVETDGTRVGDSSLCVKRLGCLRARGTCSQRIVETTSADERRFNEVFEEFGVLPEGEAIEYIVRCGEVVVNNDAAEFRTVHEMIATTGSREGNDPTDNQLITDGRRETDIAQFLPSSHALSTRQ